MDRLFLDANVLFSAAYRSDSGLRRLWDLDGIQLITSAYAIEEARRNLLDDAQRGRLDALLIPLEHVPEVLGRRLPAGIELPEKDRPILFAALDGGASHLITGDVTHFGRYFGRVVEGLRILTPAVYLRGSAKAP